MSDQGRRFRRRAVVPDRILSDKALSRRISGGDAAALDELFRRYHRSIYSYCSAMVGPEDAKDVLQNVLTKVMTSMPDNQDFKIKPWLYRVARNECIDLQRSSRKCRPGLEGDPRDRSVHADPHRATVEKEELGRLIEDLNDLPERQRSGLLMREMNGLSFAEIAESLETSPDGAKQLVYEARLSLEQAELGRNLGCSEVRQAVSSLDRRRLKGKKVRAHLRSCRGCAEFEGAIADRRADFRSVFPGLSLPVAAGILAAVRDGTTSSAVSGGAAGAMSAGATSGTACLAAKGLIAVAIVGGIGVGAKDVVQRQQSGSEKPGLAVSGSTRSVAPGGDLDSEPGVLRRLRAEERNGRAAGDQRKPGSDRKESEVTRDTTATVDRPGLEEASESSGDGERLTPGQGQGQGPASLPGRSAAGQERAAAASAAKPGQTGSAPPGLANQGAAAGKKGPDPAVPTPAPPSPGKPEPTKPDTPNKPSK